MFKFLKEKLSGWLKKEPENKETAKKNIPKRERDKFVKKESGKRSSEKIYKGKEKKTKKFIEKPIVAEEKSEVEIIKKKERFENLPPDSLTDEKNNELEGVEEGFFSRLKKKLTSSVLTQEQFDEIFQDLEIVLLENNVAYSVVQKIHDSLSKDLVNISVKKDKIEETIKQSLKESILNVLVDGEDLFVNIEKSLETYIILFFGINGSGKTTSIAKLAYLLKKKGISCVLGAADTFRAASIEQLEEHALRLGVPIVKGRYGSDPASIAFDTINYAKKNKIKVVLIDTAGRMYTNSNLLREMEKIVKISNPNLKIFVGESIAGNDATEQAKTFNDVIGIDGIILTKADVDEKAGTILSVSHVTGKPIYFLGVGQKYEDFKEFKKEDVLKGIGLN